MLEEGVGASDRPKKKISGMEYDMRMMREELPALITREDGRRKERQTDYEEGIVLVGWVVLS